MKRKILSILLALCLALTLLPVAAFATEDSGAAPAEPQEEQEVVDPEANPEQPEQPEGQPEQQPEQPEQPEAKPEPQLEAEGENAPVLLNEGSPAIVTTEAELTTALAGTAETIQLAANIDITQTLEITRTVTLDLNGYVLKMTDSGSGRVITVDGDTLTLIDSSPTAAHDGTALPAGGVITGGNVGNYDAGGGVYVDMGGTFTMTGGSITGCTAGYGGGVYVTRGSTFTMTGGSITDCTATEGSGVYLNGATMNANGGTVDGTVKVDTSPQNQKGVITSNNSVVTQFEQAVTNLGEIQHGEFTATVTVGNDGYSGTISGGTFNGPVTLTRQQDNCIKGGTFYKKVTINNGRISNDGIFHGEVVVTNDSAGHTGAPPSLYGGTYNGLVRNESTRATFDINVPLGIVGTAPNGGNKTYCKVTFDPADGTMDYTERYFLMNDDDGNDIGKISADIKPTRQGCTFLGWYTSDGTKWDHATDTVTKGMTLTARYITGSGTETDPYQISTAEGLKWFRDKVNSTRHTPETKICAVLTADIDLKNEEWTPIGTTANTYEYTGIFDGNGHTIKNLNINSSKTPAGLFGYVFGGTIRNLTVSGSVKGSGHTGGIAGVADGGTFENCANLCTVESGSTEGCTAGGIIGIALNLDYELIVRDCYNVGSITGRNAGGIIGQCSRNETISNCYNAGKVTGTANAGATVGIYYSDKISNCYYLEGSVIRAGSGDKASTAMTAAEFVDGTVLKLLKAGERLDENDNPLPDPWADTCQYVAAAKMTLPVFKGQGDAHTHNWGAWTSNGDGTHSRACACGVTETAKCSGGTATRTAKAVCQVCGQPYGQLASGGGIRRQPTGGSGAANTSGTTKTVKSGNTGDMGVMLYAGMTLLSMTGGAWVVGKKRK